ncbi:MAG TPA: NADP-dependent oxidoreductase [Candidatus Binatia bacterium]|nr:NADP-dependent oxidoreductase [Candidatus Binatia bacterium]
MWAVRAHARGGPEQLRWKRAPRPAPGPGEALVRVRAAGITPTELDWRATWVDRAGHDRTPVIPSHEFAGMVEALGPGATHVSPGDAVYGLVEFDRDGAAAEYVALRARDLAKRPATLDDVHAAAIPLSGLTAWQALVEQARLGPGARVLVHGGAGGVGSFAVQVTRVLGAEVWATASARDVPFVRGLGASRVVDHRAERFEDVVRDVDVVVDTVGGDTRDRSLAVLRPGGVLVTLGGPPPEAGPRRPDVRVVFFVVEPDRVGLERLAELADAGRLRAEVAGVYPLAEARAAYEHGRTNHPRGKLVLRVADA